MKKRSAGLFLLLILSYFNSGAQQIFDSLLNVSGTKYPQEKIYLHFDKTYYNTGETIWFKAYITANNMPTLISKTMYAELINRDGKILQRKTMPIIQAGAASFFELADSNYNSRLFVRAYTSWMLNFDSSLMYIRPVTVINNKPNAKKTVSVPAYTLTLFPEGGDLIENINCRVAFKTNDQEGIPFAVSGAVVDSKERKVVSFASTHDGMGHFMINPLPGEKYKALWKDKNGNKHELQLPEAKQKGIALSVSNIDKKLTYTLTRPDAAEDDYKYLTVVAQINQQVVYNAAINLKIRTQVIAPIPVDSLPDGIIQITVFNAAQVPVAERIAFINNNTYYFITDLHLIEKNIAKHGRNVLQVDVGDNYLANMSIAVTDAGFDASDNNNENIFSGLLLSSDLKGYIYNPAQYFLSEEDSVQQQLDLVMMTNGWRRFKWDELLSGRWPHISHLPDSYLSIKGNIYGLSKMQLKNRKITGFLKTTSGNGNTIFSIPVAEDGRFEEKNIYFFDTARLSYQLNNDKDKLLTSTASFAFNNGLERSPLVSRELLSYLFNNKKPDSVTLLAGAKLSALHRSQDEMKKTRILDVVTVKSKSKSVKDKMNEQYTSGLFSDGNAKIFTMDDDPSALSAPSILDYLRSKVAGLVITMPSGGQQETISRRGSKTDLFMNESQADINMLKNTPMSDVAMIKVFDPPFFGSIGGGAGGAVAVYTKKGSRVDNDTKGLNTSTLYGYSSIKQFYMPDYENTNTDIPDYRTTLYWNPFLLLDAKKKRITIPIFNSDNCKKIRVVIEGINEAGQLTREEKFFE